MLSCFVRVSSAISRRHHALLITTLAALTPILVVNNLNWITLCQFNNADENKTYPNALNAQSFYQKRSGILTRNTTRLCHRRATATHIKDDRRWVRGQSGVGCHSIQTWAERRPLFKRPTTFQLPQNEGIFTVSLINRIAYIKTQSVSMNNWGYNILLINQ